MIGDVKAFLDLVNLSDHDEMSDDELAMLRETATGLLISYCEWSAYERRPDMSKVVPLRIVEKDE